MDSKNQITKWRITDPEVKQIFQSNENRMIMIGEKTEFLCL